MAKHYLHVKFDENYRVIIVSKSEGSLSKTDAIFPDYLKVIQLVIGIEQEKFSEGIKVSSKGLTNDENKTLTNLTTRLGIEALENKRLKNSIIVIKIIIKHFLFLKKKIKKKKKKIN